MYNSYEIHDGLIAYNMPKVIVLHYYGVFFLTPNVIISRTKKRLARKVLKDTIQLTYGKGPWRSVYIKNIVIAFRDIL